MIIELFENLHIQHDARETGWLRVRCPFCRGRDAEKQYAAFRADTGLFFCWRCGRHPSGEALAALASIPLHDARTLLREHAARALPRETAPSTLRCKLPKGASPMLPEHKRYLTQREFDADEIAAIWGVQGTGPLADLNWRLIIPVYAGGELKSWQARALLKSQQPRYIAAPPSMGSSPKQLIYGADLALGAVVVVEGVTDAWRIGPGAVATFGVGWTKTQALLLSRYQRVSILFDAEEEAQISARKLAAEIAAISGRDVTVLEPERGDPAEMSAAEVVEVRTYLQPN